MIALKENGEIMVWGANKPEFNNGFVEFEIVNVDFAIFEPNCHHINSRGLLQTGNR